MYMATTARMHVHASAQECDGQMASVADEEEYEPGATDVDAKDRTIEWYKRKFDWCLRAEIKDVMKIVRHHEKAMDDVTERSPAQEVYNMAMNANSCMRTVRTLGAAGYAPRLLAFLRTQDVSQHGVLRVIDNVVKYFDENSLDDTPLGYERLLRQYHSAFASMRQFFRDVWRTIPRPHTPASEEYLRHAHDSLREPVRLLCHTLAEQLARAIGAFEAIRYVRTMDEKSRHLIWI